MFAGASQFNPTGYAAIFVVVEPVSRLEVGTFTWIKADGSHGYQYAPNHANLAKLG